MLVVLNCFDMCEERIDVDVGYYNFCEVCDLVEGLWFCKIEVLSEGDEVW